MRKGISAVAILVTLVGAVFTLQGIGLLGGSFMSGSAAWAVIGIALVVAGIFLYARSNRAR